MARIKNRKPTTGEIFNIYSTTTRKKYHCCGCNKKKDTMIFFGKKIYFGYDFESGFCWSCFTRMSQYDKDLLYTKFAKLTNFRKECDWCNVRSHQNLMLGGFKKQYICHNCWGYNVQKPVRRK